MLKKISLIAVGCLAAINISHAAVVYDHSGDFYLPFNFGLYSPDTARNLNNGEVGSIGLGYNINNYFAAQTSFYLMNMDQSNPSNNNNRSQSGYYWNVEGRLNAANRTIFTPYAVLGAGLLKITSSNFAWDYGVGLNIALSQNWSLDGSWRQVRQTGPSMLDNLAMAGVTYTFGSAAPVITQVPAAPQIPFSGGDQQQALQKAQTTLKNILPAGVVMCQGNHVGNQPGCVTFAGNQMIMHLNVKFMKAKANIQNQYATSLQSLGSFMSAYPNTDVVLYGYASSEGAKAFNQRLSQNRALQVEKYLVNQSGIDSSRISIVGMGIQNPIATNANEAGRAINRRVEATLPVPAQLVQVPAGS